MANIEIPIGTTGEVFKVPQWATEETQQDILAALSPKSPAGKKKAKAEGDATKSIGNLSKAATDTKEKFKGLGKTAERVGGKLEGIEASAKSVTDGLLGVVGGMGALGGAAGFAAGTFDAFVDAQVSAIQSGFSFSDQLIESRKELANIGLNFTQFSTILANNGDALRSLGETGAESATRFKDLVMVTRDMTDHMGNYGYVSEEIAGQLAELTGTLVKAGITGDELFGGAADSFTILNREVLGYARITGRNSRDMMRNRAAVDADPMFMSMMGEFGASGITAAQGMTDMATATFGEASSGIIEILKAATVEAKTGMPMMSAEMMATLEMTGLREFVTQYGKDILAAAGDSEAAARVNRDFAFNTSKHLQEQEVYIREQSQIFNAGGVAGPLAAEFGLLMQAVVESRLTAAAANDPGRATNFAETMDDTTEKLISFRNELEVFLQNLRAGVLAAFGVEDFVALDTLDFEKWGRELNTIIEDMLAWKEYLLGDDGIGVATMVAGIAALWIAPAVIAAMVAGISSLFAAKALTTALTAGAATTAATGTAAGTGMAARAAAAGRGALNLGKKIPGYGTAIAAIMGMADEEFIEADFNLISRSLLGITEALLEVGDIGANLVTGAAGVVGIGPGYDNDLDMSQAMRDYATAPHEPIPAFDPASQRIDSNHMIIQGAQTQQDGSIQTDINADNAWRHGSRGEEYLRQLTSAMEEGNRLMRRQLDAIENNG